MFNIACVSKQCAVADLNRNNQDDEQPALPYPLFPKERVRDVN